MSKAGYYVSSGKYSLKDILTFILISLVTSFFAALIYVLLNHLLTNVIFSILLVLGYVKLGALIFQSFINLCRIRNLSMYFWLGLFFGIMLYYFQWTIWIDLYLNGKISFDGVIESPIILWDTIFEIKKTYNIEFSLRGRSDEASGIILNISWILEGVIIILGPGILADLDKPFCEESKNWATATKIPVKFSYIESPTEFINKLENKEYDCIKTLGLAKPGKSYSTFTIYFCEKEKQSFLTIENVKITINNEGKKEKNENIVISLIYVDYNIARQIVLSLNKLGSK